MFLLQSKFSNGALLLPRVNNGLSHYLLLLLLILYAVLGVITIISWSLYIKHICIKLDNICDLHIFKSLQTVSYHLKHTHTPLTIDH